MKRFQPSGRYQSERDVRDHSALLNRIINEPESYVFPIIAPRRAGKTWLLNGLKQRLQNETSPVTGKNYRTVLLTLLNRNDARRFLSENLNADVVLLDEPAQLVQVATRSLAERQESSFLASLFLDRCRKMSGRDSGQRRRTIVLALSPGEWDELKQSPDFNACIQPQDIQFLPPLTDAEQRKMVTRGSDESMVPLLGQLSPDIARQPFLLETALSLCEDEPALMNNKQQLEQAVIEQAGDSEYPYFRQIFSNGLSERQQATIRAAARGITLVGYRQQDSDRVLSKCHLLEADDATPNARMRIADPIIRNAFPPPLRIHQISDIHISNRGAKYGEHKTQTSEAGAIARATGAGQPLWRRYADWLSLLPDHQKPHLLIVSGDIGEHGSVEFYEEFRNWLQSVQQSALGEHPELNGEPRILMVGGNHDVDRSLAIDAEDSQRRHAPFAEAFKDFPHPDIHEPPDQRKPKIVNYGEFGLSVLLLGSSECGQELTESEHNVALVAKLKKLEATLLATAPGSDEWKQAIRELSTIDPGVVHRQVLDQLSGAGLPEAHVKIAVVHHPVSPVVTDLAVTPYNGMINATAVKNALLRCGVSLVLHGHLHKGWFGQESWPCLYGNRRLNIAACPSLNSPYAPDGNGFQTIELTREGDRYECRVQRYINSGEDWNAAGAPMCFDATNRC